jgi:predicted nucleotidyltransferase
METRENLIDILIKVIGLLKENNYDYALTGGLAYSALVEPRATMDIDIIILLKESEIGKLINKFEKKFISVIPHEKLMKFDFIKIWRILCKVNDHESIIDFILADQDFLENILKRSLTLNFMGIDLKVVSLEDLVLLKSISDRDQDKADLKKILYNSDNQIDREYLNLWASKLNIKLSLK